MLLSATRSIFRHRITLAGTLVFRLGDGPLQFRRSFVLAIAAGISITCTLATARADTFFSFFETTDAKPASRSADRLAPASPNIRADTGAPAIGVWSTIIVPASDAPVASRAGAKGEHSQHLPGPRLTGTGHSLSGVASYYWQGQMTATGERFNKRDMTAAHKTLPFGTRVRVTRVDTGSSVIVRINDRGPFKPGRVIDLSERAAEEIGMTGAGLSPVRLEVLGR